MKKKILADIIQFRRLYFILIVIVQLCKKAWQAFLYF